MNILVIGSGAREHCIADTLSNSVEVDYVFVSPGNAGIERDFVCVVLPEQKDILEFCQTNEIDFVFIGPEKPLSEGLTDYLRENSIRVVGPTRDAARIETSKVFAKELMREYGVPTADYSSFSSYQEALDYLIDVKFPTVIKADGLAAGKGVMICEDFESAKQIINELMCNKTMGEAGENIVIEEFLRGWEVSLFAFTDGNDYQTTVFAQDYKRIFEGDLGPNTGGMGAVAPVLKAEAYRWEIEETILKPTLRAMREKGCPFSGVLFLGLMICESGPKVIEFNCRLGDPETEVVLPLLKTDLAEVCLSILDGNIGDLRLEWEEKMFAATVVCASKGYPNTVEDQKLLYLEQDLEQNAKVYFAGVKSNNDDLITSGGRILTLTCQDSTLEKTLTQCYSTLKKISFEGMQYRTDIGKNAL